MVTNLEVSLADMYTGRTVEVSLDRTTTLIAQFQIPRKIICTQCAGSGAASEADIQQCTQCNGQGIVIQRHQVFPGMVTNVQMTYVQALSLQSPC